MELLYVRMWTGFMCEDMVRRQTYAIAAVKDATVSGRISLQDAIPIAAADGIYLMKLII
jgi:hypothetical protein